MLPLSLAKKHAFVWIIAVCFTVLSTGFMPEAALANGRRSAISQLSLKQQNQVQVFLPGQLVLGNTSTFSVRGNPGQRVLLFFGPGPKPDNQQELSNFSLSADSPRLEGIIPESGVLQLELPVPAEETLAGNWVFFEGMATEISNPNSVLPLAFRGADGQFTNAPLVQMLPPAKEAKGAQILPNMPGVDSQVMRQLGTLAEISQSNDERRRKLIEDDGTINRNREIDRNSLIQPGLPGLISP